MRARACSVLPLAACVALQVAPVRAHHISESLDVAGVRTPLGSTEGYLSYHVFSPRGEERTGWTDVRHPSLAGFDNTTFGYDRSDFLVNIASHTVTDGMGNTANPNRVRDFEYASAAHVQAGIAVIEKSHQLLTNAAFLDILNTAELATMFGAQRDNGANVVNSYYVQSFTSGSRGQALSPEDGANNGIAQADNALNDTMAHELGHFLVDSYRYTPGDSFHNDNDGGELMASGGVRNPPANLDQVGRPNGNLGGRDQIADMVHLKTVPNPEFHQERIFNETPSVGNPTVAHTDNGLTHGDVADFDWVADNTYLEQAGGLADNHDGAEWMVWSISPILHSTHTGHDHDDWGELDLPAYDRPFFRVVDVVSQFGIWVDEDVDAGGDFDLRGSYLDYALQFSEDGVSWVSGTPIIVFIEGWTTASDAEDYVVRWVSSVDARFVRISELLSSGHDGNTQIDAIIAAQFPDPAHVPVLPAFGGLLLAITLLGVARAAALRRV